MKRKYYRIREYLYGYEAAEYLGALTGVSLDSDDFFSIVNSHLPAYIDCLNEPFVGGEVVGGEVDGLPLKVVPVGLQKVQSHLHWFNDSELRFCFNPPKSFLERDRPFYVDLEGVISVDSWFDEVFSSWRAEGGFLYLVGAALVFLPTDVEALAAKMNDEPDYQALQKENQRLSQGAAELKAMVKRLEAEKEYLQREMLATERAHNRLADQLTALTEQHDLCMISLEGADEETEDAYREVERLQAENTELKEEVGRLQADSKNGAVLFGHESENLRLVEWAINEFYHPDKFDVNDPKTHPKQEYMLAEIMRVHGVTGVTAKAVERIATPFSRDRAKK